MGGAILQGLVASGLAAGGVTATNRTATKAAELANLPGVASIALEAVASGNVDAAAAADIVLVGVKPVMVPDLLREIGASLRPARRSSRRVPHPIGHDPELLGRWNAVGDLALVRGGRGRTGVGVRSGRAQARRGSRGDGDLQA